MIGVISVLFFLHPFHVSVTEVEYKEKTHTLQIVLRTFVDDLELSLQESLGRPYMDILSPEEPLTTESLLSGYLKNRFHIKINAKDRAIKFLGYEQEGLALLCYLEIDRIRKIDRIEITNTIITDVYDDQSNMIHVTYKREIKSLRLTREDPSDVLVF